MDDFPKLQVNSKFGFYEKGKPFSPSKWGEVQSLYLRELGNEGGCTVRRLAKKAKNLLSSASKAIAIASTGVLVPPARKKDTV